WYSQITGRPGEDTKLGPSVDMPAPSTPQSSSTVGARSTSDTGVDTVPAAPPGTRTNSGTRAAGSRNDILYQSPRSPRNSPWSAVNTTIVSESRPVARSAPNTEPIRSST